ncbi:unnamed protein product, partial [Adineta ricciae]
NQNVELSNIPEEKNSFSSLYALSDPIVEHNDNDNQSHLFTSTPILASLTSYRSAVDENHNSTSLSTDKNKNNKSLPFAVDNSFQQSSASTLSTYSAAASPESSQTAMSLYRHSSSASHPYDQRISDQGNKYIIQLKTDEYQENDFTITPRSISSQIIIDAKHREEDSTGGYVHRELHKIFNIPKHIDLNRYAYTYNPNTQELTIEMPYLSISSVHSSTEPLTQSSENRTRPTNGNLFSPPLYRATYSNQSNPISGSSMATTGSTPYKSLSTPVASNYESSVGNTKPFDFDLFHRSAFRPQIVRTSTNDTAEKKLIMSLDLSDYQAEDIKVTVKERELIVNAERKIESGTRKSRSSFFQSTSLPPQTDLDHLQTNFTNGRLTIEAPYLDQTNSDRRLKTASLISTNTNNNNQESNW